MLPKQHRPWLLLYDPRVGQQPPVLPQRILQTWLKLQTLHKGQPVPWYTYQVPCMPNYHWYLGIRVRTIMLCHNFLIGKRHMCTENHVCFGRIHGSQLREEANAGQHTYTLSDVP